MTPGTRTRVTPGCCDGAEAERAPARGTSPITTSLAPAHRLLAQRRRVRSAGAAPRRQSLTWVDGGERAAVSGVEGLQQVGGLAAARFADDDVIRAVT